MPKAKRTAQGQSRFFIALHADDLTMPRPAGVRFGMQGDNPFEACGVPWLSVSCCGTKLCSECDAEHGWRIEVEFEHPPRIMLVDVNGRLGSEVWIPLTFPLALPAGGSARYELVSYARGISEVIKAGGASRTIAHYVGLVRKEKGGKSWICYDDSHVTQYARVTLVGDWINDSVRLAVYARVSDPT